MDDGWTTVLSLMPAEEIENRPPGITTGDETLEYMIPDTEVIEITLFSNFPK